MEIKKIIPDYEGNIDFERDMTLFPLVKNM